MTKISLLSFAACAALAATPALAQPQGGGARAGASWQGGHRAGGHVGGVTVRHQGGRVGHAGGNFGMRHRGGNVVVRHRGGGNVVVRHHSGFRGGFHPGRNVHRRLHRGVTIHPFWFGPQFHIGNWQAYGFADPGPDRRWVRYYDDAYLIDHGGRVVDTRYGLDWDQYGERWTEEDGIPSYYGSRDYRPGEEDYAWVEQHGGPEREEGWNYADHEGDFDPGPEPGHGPMPHPGFGPGYAVGHGGHGYAGYGYGWAYPIVIETTVVSGGYTEEIVEEVVETRRRAHRPRRARPCNCAPAPVRRPPPAGERG